MVLHLQDRTVALSGPGITPIVFNLSTLDKQLEVFCDYCQCKVKKYRWSRHLQTEKHKHNETVKNDEEEKINKMTEEEKD